MPPRIPISSAVRPVQTCFKSQACQFSKTASPKALRNMNPAKNSTSKLLDLESSGPATKTGRTGAAIAQSVWSKFASETKNGAPEGERMDVRAQLHSKAMQEDYMRQAPRRFNLGDVYAPHDLSAVEMKKWRTSTSPERDLVDLLGLKPLDMYRNFSFLAEFTTTHGRIKKGEQTGLRPVNQRKVAKAIRRAIGLGLQPSVHRHPELLKRERRVAGPQSAATGKIGQYM